MPAEQRIGTVTHYYPRAHAAAVQLEQGEVHIGDVVHVAGRGVDFREKVTSLQIDNEPIQEAHAGQTIGVWLSRPAPANAEVFLVREEDQKPGFWSRLFGR